jgi:hypothetical protein
MFLSEYNTAVHTLAGRPCITYADYAQNDIYLFIFTYHRLVNFFNLLLTSLFLN